MVVIGPLVAATAVLMIDPWSTLVLLFTGPMLVLLLAVIGRRTRSLTRRRFDELGWSWPYHVVHDLERFLNTLGTIASLAPLMGLFGTVVGMIEIFGAQNSTGTNPAQLAHGISVALYNTGFGLAIAMPALVFYRHFRALVDSFVIDMELQSVKLVDIVHGARK